MSMTDSLKRVLLTGVGAVATTVDKAQELVDEFVKKGELTVDQGKELMEDFKNKNMKANFGFVKKEEFDALKARMDELEKKVNVNQLEVKE